MLRTHSYFGILAPWPLIAKFSMSGDRFRTLQSERTTKTAKEQSHLDKPQAEKVLVCPYKIPCHLISQN
jgi:hypothetical protein